jgi:hypothetical protein
MTTKVCQNCSAMTETEKTFCPECGTVYQAAQPTAASSGGQPTAASGWGVDRLTIAIAVLAGAIIVPWIGDFLQHWDFAGFTYALKIGTGWWVFDSEFQAPQGIFFKVGDILQRLAPLILSSTGLILALMRRRRA